MELILQTNKYQSDISKYEGKLPKEAYNNILQAIEDYEYLKRLISPNRKYVSDLERDSEGAAIIDLSNLHILEDMDYFRQPIIKFLKTGKYTDAIPSSYKKSAWALFWKEEARKCLSRVINPETGEWIPGDFYFYLNYSPIMRIVKNDSGEEIDRVQGFPDIYDGDYLYFHYCYKARHYKDDFSKGMHTAAMKCRGRGYSLKESSKIAKRFVLGDSIMSQKKVRAIALASEKEYLTKDGILNKFSDIVSHCADHTGWFKSMIKSSWNTMEWRSGYMTKEGFERGRLNEVIGVSMKDNPGKARGKRANLIVYEEFGKFPNLLEAYRTNRPSVEAGPIAFGQQCLIGTGGETGEAFEGATEMVYNPEGYRILGVPNIYDKGLTGNTTSALFVSEVLNLEGYYDKDGNSDVIAALAFIMRDRFNVKYNTSKPEGISGHIAEHPISLAESIMRKEGSIFPTAEIKEYLDHCRAQGPSFFKSSYVGELVADSNGTIKWCPNNNLSPLRSFRLGQHDNKEGCLEIFEMPKKDSNGVISNRYIVYVDPIDSDSGTSLGSVGVFDTFYQWVVAEYTGRPKFANDFYEIVRKLALFYNGIINYENNLKGLYTYFDQKHCTYLLCDNPSILVDKEMMKRGYGNTLKGTRAEPETNAYGRRLIRDWLITDAKSYFQEFDDEGNQITHYLNLHTIKSLPLLEELLAWDGVINTDRVSAMIMCMILNEEYKKYNQVFTEKTTEKDFASNEYWSQYASSGGFSYGPSR